MSGANTISELFMKISALGKRRMRLFFARPVDWDSNFDEFFACSNGDL